MSHRNVRAARPLAVVLMLFLLAACGNSGGDAAPTTTGVTASPESPVETTPPVEETGTEAPPPTSTRRPAIELASLPIGGGSQTGTSERDQCIEVAWLGSEMPDGISVEVTSKDISPKRVFRFASLECGRPCDGYVFQEQGDDCLVAVHALRANTRAALSLGGKIHCPAGQRAECEAFSAGEQKQTIGLRWEPEEPESPSPSPAPPEPTG